MNTFRCAVITVSNHIDKDSDASGRIILERLQAESHHTGLYEVIPDDPDSIVQVIRYAAKCQPSIDCIIINGGTGISGRDSALEAVDSLLEKKIPGFGELFRHLLFTENGRTSAMRARATAGVYRKMAVFSIPEDPESIQLAMQRLIIPELVPMIQEIRQERILSKG